MTDYSELERLAKAATPGPWEHYYAKELRGRFGGGPVNEVNSDERCPIVKWSWFDDSDRSKKSQKANAKFIAAANPATILSLLSDIASLKSQLAQAEAQGEVRGIAKMREIEDHIIKLAEVLNIGNVERAQVRASPDPLYRDHMYTDQRNLDEVFQKYYELHALTAAKDST